MHGQALRNAQRYEEAYEKDITAEMRPVFHLTPRVGWMNDPNGFSYYNGEYHIFYQYNPYSSHWDTMHWGHAKSKDLIHWEYLPAVMAPDEEYDFEGCFSGDAIELDDGRQMLIYTGVSVGKDSEGRRVQSQDQNIAFGDGTDYVKYEQNPVIRQELIPGDIRKGEFRDPKIWRDKNGDFVCLASVMTKERLGRIVLFKSQDGINWKYWNTLIENDGSFGKMWECPDLFELDGRWVFLTSPMDMVPKGFEYHNGNGNLCMIGDFDEEEGVFTPESDHAIDYGIDFYATQTTCSPDGRLIMLGWLQNWDACAVRELDEPWAGQLSTPRELSIKNGRLYQTPVRELEKLRADKVEYTDVEVGENTELEGINGRVLDMEISIRAKNKEALYEKFAIWFAKQDDMHTALRFRPHDGTLKVDRKFSGSRRAILHQRRCYVGGHDGSLKLRIIMDRFSAEIFINDGEKVMSVTLYTGLDADGIAFRADGDVVMDITKYSLKD